MTGFRKRKQKRRKEAIQSLEKIQREQRIEERAERREAKRRQWNLDDDGVGVGVGGAAGEGGEKVQVFESEAMMSTVRVIPMVNESDDEEGQVAGRRPLSSVVEGATIGKGQQSGRDVVGGKGARLSKSALAILSNTKLKVQGKKKSKGGGGVRCGLSGKGKGGCKDGKRRR